MLRLCPYLGAAGSAWVSVHPDHEHHCGAVTPAVAVALEKQRRLCVTASHAACATYEAATARMRDRPLEARAAGGTPVERTVTVRFDRPAAAAARGMGEIPLGQVGLAAIMVLALAVVLYARLLAPVAPSTAAQGTPATAAGIGAASASPAATASATVPSGTAATAAPSPVTSPPPTPTAATTSPRPSATPAPTRPPVATQPYKVASRDTLSRIASRFHTTVATLQALNGLGSSTAIYAGQTILVPA